jgi:hypothetical protein
VIVYLSPGISVIGASLMVKAASELR